MKQIICLFVVLTAIACSKKDENPGNSGGSTSNNNVVYYIDSAKIYSTNLSGGERKLLVGIDTLNRNSYINRNASVSVDGNKIFFMHRISGSTPSTKIYAVNKDGTGLVAIKTLSTINEYGFMKGTNDNKIVFFQNAITLPSTQVRTIESMNADGSSQATIATIPSTFNQIVVDITRSGDRYVSTGFSGTTTTSSTGSLSGGVLGTSRSLPTGSQKPKLSSDGKKIAYIKEAGTDRYEIYIYDIATEASTLVATPTFPFTVAGIYQIGVHWIEGSAKILVSAGKSSFPSSASDYTYCSLYTVGSTATPVIWQFAGDAADVFTE